MKRKFIINTIYALLWFLPLFFFARDFFHLNDLKIVLDSDIVNLVKFTVYQALLSSILAFIIGIIPAYYVAYSKGFVSKLLEGLIFIPFFFPVISTVTVFSIIFTSSLFKNLEIMYSIKAIVIANIFYNSPIFIKYISDGVKKIPREIVEAFKLDGANEIQIFFYCKVPLIMPQIFRAFFMVFTYSFISLGIVLSLGGIRYSTVELEIANTLMGSLDFSRAFSLGVLQFIILFIINLIGFRIEEYELNGEKIEEKKNILIKIYSIIYLFLEYSIIGISVIFSFYNFYEGKFSLKSLKRIFSYDFNLQYPVIKGIFNSTMIAGISSVAIVVLSYTIIKNYSKFTNTIIFANLGISGAFLAISLYYLNILFDIPLFILLIIGNIFISIPIAYSLMYQYVKKFPKDILEMSMIDCKKRWQRYLYIEFPILKNFFISAFLQIFAIIFGEFTLAYTMQIGDNLPIVSIVNYSLVTEKRFLESSALSTVVIIFIFLLFLLGEYFKRRD